MSSLPQSGYRKLIPRVMHSTERVLVRVLSAMLELRGTERMYGSALHGTELPHPRCSPALYCAALRVLRGVLCACRMPTVAVRATAD